MDRQYSAVCGVALAAFAIFGSACLGQEATPAGDADGALVEKANRVLSDNLSPGEMERFVRLVHANPGVIVSSKGVTSELLELRQGTIVPSLVGALAADGPGSLTRSGLQERAKMTCLQIIRLVKHDPKSELSDPDKHFAGSSQRAGIGGVAA
jgi:hypothetical protein